MEFLFQYWWIILVVVLVLLVIVVLTSTLVHARPDEVVIISGLRKQARYISGQTAIRLPILEKVDRLTLKPVKVDVKTDPRNPIPTSDFIGVNVDSNFFVKVDPDHLEVAAKHFLNESPEQIAKDIQEALQGNLREIVGQSTLESLSKDRKALGDSVQETAAPDMAKLGLIILSSNIQSLEDTSDLIAALGQENSSRIQRDAKLAKFNAEKEIRIAEAQAQKDANEVRARADLEIARQNTAKELEVARQHTEKEKQILAMKQLEDTERAKADAAYKIEEAIHKKRLITEEQAAAIERATQQEELNKKEIILQEQKLEAEIKKKADADLYQRQKDAEARLFEEQKEAEARFFAVQKENEARKAKAEAEAYEQMKKAEAIRALGQAEAESKKAIGLAEAEAIDRIAEAKKNYGEMQMAEKKIEAQEMLIKALPEIAAAIAQSVGQIGNMTVYGGSSEVAGIVPAVMKQVFDTTRDAAGIDLSDLLMKDSRSAQTDRNVTISHQTASMDDASAEKDVPAAQPDALFRYPL